MSRTRRHLIRWTSRLGTTQFTACHGLFKFQRLYDPNRGKDLVVKGVAMIVEHTITIRVRYPEVDAMGFLHHSRYLQYFEMGRIELLRSLGHSYAELESAGLFFVVVKVECRY